MNDFIIIKPKTLLVTLALHETALISKYDGVNVLRAVITIFPNKGYAFV